MKKTLWTGMLAGSLIMAGQSAQAADLAIAAKASTLGAGVELTTNIVPMLVNVRLQLNGLNYSNTITDTQVRYDSTLKLLTAGAIVDFYPFASKFRISGGLYYNGNKLDITGQPAVTGSYTFNGTTYSTAQVGTVNGRIDFNNIAPYIGIGWGDAISSGSPVGFSFEVGALYQGSPKTTITTSRSVAGLSANIAAEQKKIDDALNNFKVYPVVAIGVNWRF